MKYILLFVLLINSIAAKESCYTVQLLSKFASDKNKKILSQTRYDTSCKTMTLGRSLTVRCGCFAKIKEAKSTLPQFLQKYPKAYIATTYAYRFETKKQKKILLQHTESYKSNVLVTQIVPNQVSIKQQTATKIATSSSKKQLIDKKQKLTHKVKKPKVLLKKKKHKKKKHKKKKKVKYVKKQPSYFSYQKYLKKLKNKKGIGSLDYKYRFGAQLSYDKAYIEEAAATYNDRGWRRIRVYHQGSILQEKLFYELEYSFTGQNQYKDNFLGYQDKLDNFDTYYRVKLGNIKIPFSLQRYSSSKNLMFMERALNDAYADGRKLGAELLLGQKFDDQRINLFLSTYSNSIDEKQDNIIEQPGSSMRLTYANKIRKNHLFSCGFGLATQDMKNQKVKFKQSSESAWMPNNYVKATVKNVDSITKNNFEVLYIYDKYSLQAEYSSATLKALKDTYTFDGYYLEGSYFILGNGRTYKFKNSTLSKIKPNKGGALELAFRYSYLNLNDKSEQNGSQTDYNFGVNLYISSEIKLLLNYIIAKPQNSPEYNGRLQILQSRILFAF